VQRNKIEANQAPRHTTIADAQQPDQ